MIEIPFRPDQELYRKLKASVPYSSLDSHHAADTSHASHAEQSRVPGQPHLPVSSPETRDFLLKELLTPKLDALAPHLWLVAKQDSSHVSSLTEQLVRGRQIILTQNPELHLVWYHDRVFIMPLPKYLLSHSFWQLCLSESTSPFENEEEKKAVFQGALGFLRSYSYLIQHKSDFVLAMDPKHRLLPRSLKFSDFVCFISTCRTNTPDSTVSPRFHFGELRLSRLNFWAKIFLQQFTFHKVYHQYSDRLARFYGPLLFIFAILSLVLNAMQVAVSAQPLVEPQGFSKAFNRMSLGFSIWTLGIVVLAICFLLLYILVPLLRELIFACSDLRIQRNKAQRSKNRDKPGA